MVFNQHKAIDRAHRELKWPIAAEIFHPSGAGPRALVDLVRRKLERPISRMENENDVRFGVLSRDPMADETVSPLAIVCEFRRPASHQTIREAHRLAWNFSHSPVLITLEPHQIRAWTCYERPSPDISDENPSAEISEIRTILNDQTPLTEQAADSLHWVELVTGHFFEMYEDRFQRDACADRLLLKNLKEVREILVEERNLDVDICHDLLARIIFIQFLVDRKDSTGMSALSKARFAALHKNGVLSQAYTGLEDLLLHYDDTYNLFQWLNEKFNGDLFPGSGRGKERQKEEWAREQAHVDEKHLHILAEFVGGRMDFQSRQGLLWRHYSFDVIPLEFISSIYEEFVTRKDKKRIKKTGTVYTPPHLVDFILDGVLPWSGKNWDLKILDPACGSGIFLVKAFQRLVRRWKESMKRKPGVAELRRFLTHNLFGVDRDEHAVRVASFSLYLAMCDEIDPRHYWTRVRFPSLRGKSIVAADFFSENVSRICVEENAGSFDLVIGNPPWGRRTVGDSDIHTWEAGGWKAADNNIGPMFLPKAAALTKQDGLVSIIQPSSLLTNKMGTNIRFRYKLFSSFNMEEVVNLSTLRFGLYKGAIGPSCILTFNPTAPDGKPFSYFSPKELKTIDDDLRIVIEPNDVHLIHQDDAAKDSTVWSTFAWGGHRESVLIRRLAKNTNLNDLWHDGRISKRQGIVRSDRKREDIEIRGRRILDDKKFPEGTFLILDPHDLPENDDTWLDAKASTDYSAFKPPQLIIKQGWKTDSKRFEAAIVKDGKEGVLCSQSYTSIHLKRGANDILETACLAMNSRFAAFYLALTSGRMATFIPTVTVDDLLNVPLPEIKPGLLQGVSSYDEVDERVKEAFGFTDGEWVLIEDLFNFTLPDFKGNAESPGRLPTRSLQKSDRDKGEESFLRLYCDYFLRVLKSGFGDDKSISVTIFSEKDDSPLPVRLLAIHLDDIKDGDIHIEKHASASLRDRLMEWDERLSSTRGGKSTGALHQRVARVYDVVAREGKKVPTIYMIKPDRRRYWTRSAAMRDADAAAADIMAWTDIE